MNIKQKYRVHDLVKYDYSEIREYIGNGYTDKPLRNDEIVDLLNHYEDDKILKINIIRKLKKENEQLKSDNKCYVKRYSELFEDYIACKKGNEQLKQDIKELKEE